MLALASSFYMLALALAQAVIALKGHALVSLGWGIGVVTFVLVTWLSSDELFRRIELGLLVLVDRGARCVRRSRFASASPRAWSPIRRR